MKKLKAHLFICTNCTYKYNGNEESDNEEAKTLKKNLKKRLGESFPKDEVRVSSASCLSMCEHGIASVLYPQGRWNLSLRLKDEDALFEKVVETISS